MTSIQSAELIIEKSASEIYQFLVNLNNHQQLMPESIYNWTSTEDDCQFTIQNMAKLQLQKGELTPNASINIIPKGDVPFALDLNWRIAEKGDSSASVQMTINADLNPFIKMMAVGPLTKLVNHQAEQLKSILEKK